MTPDEPTIDAPLVELAEPESSTPPISTTTPAEVTVRLKPTVNSKAEFDSALASARGPVLVDFIQDGCGHCEEETPVFQKLLADCAGAPATIMRVEVTADWASELADKLDVQGTPTALLASNANDFLAGRTKEVDLNSKALRGKLKCGR